MKKFTKFLRANKALAAVEFALIAPVFFLIFFGIIEFGLTMFVDSTLNTAVRAAARAGITKGYGIKDVTDTDADAEDPEEQFRKVMAQYMGGLYRDKTTSASEKGMVVSAQVVGCVPNSSLDKISKNVQDGTFFKSPVFNLGSCTQSSRVVVYGVQYNWGGMTGLMRPFIPTDLYAITVVRNEAF